MRHLPSLGLLLMLMAGCASAPTPRLDQADTRMAELQGDVDIAERAPQAMAEARSALQRARQAEDTAEIEHRAEIVLHKARIVRYRARQAAAEARRDAAQKAMEQLRDQVRERREQAAAARAQAERERELEQERKRQAIRQQARQRRQLAARSQDSEAISTTAAGLAEIRAQLAELNPRLNDRGLVLTLGEALFDIDSASLKPYTQRIMDRLASFLQDNPGYRVRIEGHTDNAGTAEYNLQLARMRAHAVEEALALRGVQRLRMTTQGYGERRPVASNETAAGRRENRRVEVILSRAG